MFIIRQSQPQDLKGLLHLASVFNTVNLPNDEGVLKELLEISADSFSGKIEDPGKREYVFVMEEPDTQRLVGTSMVIAQHGHRDAPHIFFDVRQVERYSETIDKLFKHKVLQIGFSYDGPTEIGGLVLDPNYRGRPGKLGKQLSFIRFLFIAMHRSFFRERLLAELLPPLSEYGHSKLWEACGRRFTGLSYQDADKISKDNKEFIKGLFPSGPIHASLFATSAQEVIGQVGENTKGVQSMLEKIGFHYVNRVDPFDGGPHFEADTDAIWPVNESRKVTFSIVEKNNIREASGESAEGLLAHEKSGTGAGLRAGYTAFRFDDKKHNVIQIGREDAERLQITEGGEGWMLPFVWQTRR